MKPINTPPRFCASLHCSRPPPNLNCCNRVIVSVIYSIQPHAPNQVAFSFAVAALCQCRSRNQCHPYGFLIVHQAVCRVYTLRAAGLRPIIPYLPQGINTCTCVRCAASPLQLTSYHVTLRRTGGPYAHSACFLLSTNEQCQCFLTSVISRSAHTTKFLAVQAAVHTSIIPQL